MVDPSHPGGVLHAATTLTAYQHVHPGMDAYQHVHPGMEQQAADRFAALLDGRC